MKFMLRIRCWEYRQLAAVHRASRPTRPDKARRLGYKAKQVGHVCGWSSSDGGNMRAHCSSGLTIRLRIDCDRFA